LARLLEGKPIAERIKEELKQRIAAAGKKLTLASVQVGTSPASDVYLKSQKRNAELLGIEYQLHTLDKETSQEQLQGFIRSLNANCSINGIILQRPLPPHVDCKIMSCHIAPEKDVEGMNPVNLGKLVFGKAKILPCAAAAALELLISTGIDFAGKEAVIVGHSEIVGKPLSMLLLDRIATVTVCHVGTSKAGKLEEHVRRAEVLVVAVGKAGLVKGDWIREGAAVVDVGINRVGDNLVGDVEFDAAQKRAGWITPVPGGVGPLTVIMLMRNLVEANL
jgi:methylenetetrahydrofolate dehydrogenase (NADP+) / methenyltetrahydrofolate cyclohydrolase